MSARKQLLDRTRGMGDPSLLQDVSTEASCSEEECDFYAAAPRAGDAPCVRMPLALDSDEDDLPY